MHGLRCCVLASFTKAMQADSTSGIKRHVVLKNGHMRGAALGAAMCETMCVCVQAGECQAHMIELFKAGDVN